ncbi:AEC family transporter [Microvirga sp. W0021]|uniref:AEC family transporter n=1 Tax=Hohaiivirga grylli TaxID=3133970 RepID=A0ABV0BPK7_9HYPH
MLTAILIVLPVFGLVMVGYSAIRFNLLSEKAGIGISEFVFNLGMPALMFRTLVHAEFPSNQPWGYWISYFGGALGVWVISSLISGKIFKQNSTEGVVAGFAAGQSNTMLMGIPMIMQAYGKAAEVPLFMLIAIHLPIIMTLATILAEGRKASVLTLIKRLVTHPIMAGIILGLIIRPFGHYVPEFIWKITDPVATAAGPCALIAMGISLHRYGIEAGWKQPSIISFLKLIMHPLLVYVLASYVFTMPPVWIGVAVLFAACPTGVNAYIFAAQYRQGIGLASTTLTLSTALSIFTIVMWLRVLGV